MQKKVIAGVLKRLLALIMLGMIAVFSAALVEENMAMPPEASGKLKAGVQSYKSANYESAIKLLTAVVNDEGSDLESRKEALRYLGRCYVAKQLTEKAKQSILDLLELEPPIIDFDPDRESPPMMKVYYEARKDHAGSYQLERKDPGIKTMAILDFKNSSIDEKEKYDPMEKGFADIMITELNGAVNLKVVERERIQWILDELKIQDQYNMEGAVRAGKQLGVHTVLLGSYILVKKELWLSARLVKVESSEILLTAQVKGKVDKFFELTNQLGKKIAGKIDSELDYASKDDEADENSNSLEAMLAYSEGLSLLERSDYAQAYAKFREALDHDPGYKRAELKAASIKNLVAYSEGP